MKKIKSILIIILKVATAIAILFSMGFVNKQQKFSTYNKLEVSVNQDNELYFLERGDIVNMIQAKIDTVIGQTKNEINVTELEIFLINYKHISKAEIFSTIDGKLKVKVEQRKPVVRIINNNNYSYYIDEQGKLMDLSNKFTANILIANGHITTTDSLNYLNNPNSDSLTYSILGELYAMARYINKDEFWKSQIHQMYINDDKEIILTPLVGNQKIIFGDTLNMKLKFTKLLTFYQQGLNTTGWWNKYSTINLKYKNQIVCKKK